MVITQTPFRMSFVGGGTDFPEFYRKYGGSVISTTFDKYCYVTVRHLPRFFDYRSHITYSKTESVDSSDEIVHPAIRETMKYMDMHELRLIYDADLPTKSGIGTSSSFVVGMLNAFYALKGKYVDKRKLADDAIYVERELCAEIGGIQDQIAASFGGLNRIKFTSDGYTVQPIIIPAERKQSLCDNLMLFFTGFSRYSPQVQETTRNAIPEKISQLQETMELVDEAERILTGCGSLNEFGKLLDHVWHLKRTLSSDISNSFIDECYKKAKSAGALGGKILGAGGGGFLLFYAEPDKQKTLLKVLNNLLYVPFQFENSGTKVIHFEQEAFSMDNESNEVNNS